MSVETSSARRAWPLCIPLAIGAVLLALLVAPSGPQRADAAKLTRGIATGTLYFNRVETKDVARGGTAGASALCGAVAAFTGGAGGAICAAVAAPFVIQAIRADNREICLKIKFSPPTLPFLAPATWPDIYGGGYCR
jgi:hypothetical protein